MTQVSPLRYIPSVLARQPGENVFFYCSSGLCLKLQGMKCGKKPIWYNDSEEAFREKSWRKKKRKKEMKERKLES